MPLKVSVGLSQKVGLPDYGSLGASCHVEVELDAGMLDRDAKGFQSQVTKVYAACRQAVEQELARHRASSAKENERTHPNGGSTFRTTSNGQSGREWKGSSLSATPSQVRALWAIASRQGIDLLNAIQEACDVDRPERLSRSQASRLIDELNASPTNSRRSA